MPDGIVYIKGLPELQEKLKKLGLVVQRQILTKGVKAGAELIREEAERNAPTGGSGFLKTHIIISEAGMSNSVDEVRVKIGPEMAAFYGLFQELGTAHHAARPFLRPALESNRDRAIAIMGEVLKAAINKAVK